MSDKEFVLSIYGGAVVKFDDCGSRKWIIYSVYPFSYDGRICWKELGYSFYQKSWLGFTQDCL